MATFRIDATELRERRQAGQLADEDLAHLARLRPLSDRIVTALVDDFYRWLLEHVAMRKLLPDKTTLERVKKTQRRYFLGLFEGRCDSDYVEDRLRVGAAHERIGLSPKWYLAAYRKYIALLHDCLRAELPPAEAQQALSSLLKLVFFDAALAIDVYMAANAETVRGHQKALLELATPVARVHDEILLLPVVGTLDTARIEQIIDAMLTRVTAEHAKVALIDIAGVPVVDSQVAGALLKLAAMLRLLGAHTIVTGIRADVARTIVRLGVDAAMMQTCASLQEGIALALDLVGKVVVDKPIPPA